MSTVSVTFFGTTTLAIRDDHTTLLVDGFFSRPALWRLPFSRLSPSGARIDKALDQAELSQADALLVAHSHHDHALDASYVAAKLGALLVGSTSTLNLGRGSDLPESQLIHVRDGSNLTFGAFEIAIIETPHSPGAVFPGRIHEPLVLPARSKEFRCGECFSFYVKHPSGSLLIVPSANFTPGALAGLKADALYLGVGTLGRQSRRFQQRYWDETVGLSGARLIVPIHWDNFGRQLSRPLTPLPFPLDNMRRTRKFLSEQAGVSAVTVRFQDRFETIQPFAILGMTTRP